MWWYQQLLSGFLAEDYLLRISGQSRLLGDDKGDNEMIPAVVLTFNLQLR